MYEINDYLKNWFENKMRDKNDILRRAKDFKEKGYTKFKIGELVPEELMNLICEETNEIIGNHGIRRDLNMETTELMCYPYFRQVPLKITQPFDILAS